MKRRTYLGIGILLIAAALAGLWIYPRVKPSSSPGHPKSLKQAEEESPVALVKTTPLRRGRISETLTAYGTVIPSPGKLQTYNVSYECQIRKLLVTEGQPVKAGDALLEIAASPDTLLHFEQAKNELATARSQEQFVKERLELKLATRDELLAAHSTLVEKEKQLADLRARGVGAKENLAATTGGIVYSIGGFIGEILPAGSNLAQIVEQDQILISFGIEPEDRKFLTEGETIKFKSLMAQSNSENRALIKTITQRVDPKTRLVNVLAAPEDPGVLLLDDFIEVEAAISADQALIVPRQAALPEGDSYVVFSVKDGRAVKHQVRIGLENPEQLQVFAEDLQEGDSIVTLGNYEISEGMPVRK